jgi:hypothetical protein
VCSDNIERKRAEEKLRASEQRFLDAQLELAHITRMTTLGELRASISHEVTTPELKFSVHTTAFSASSRLFDLNGEARMARTNQISAIIAPT